MFTFTTTLTTLVVSCAAIIPGCQPEPKPACEPGITITVDYQAETPCDLDGSQQLNEIHNPMLTNESFTTICLDSGGVPVITETKKECDDRDY